MTTSRIQKAVRYKKKLRLALLGPTGAGKTRTGLEIARGLVGPDGKIGLIDTEHGSASMYSDFVDFDVIELSSFAAQRYIEAIEEFETAGYDVLVIDSLSHAWAGKDGILEFVDRTKKGNNSFNAWGDATPQQNKLVEKLLACKMHLVVTMRVKMDHVQERDERTGKTIVRKIGLQPVQRDGVEYEFDVTADIDMQHTLTVAKTRIDPIEGESINKAGAPFGEKLRKWLDGGAVKPAEPLAPVEREDSGPNRVAGNGAEMDERLRAVRAGIADELARLHIPRDKMGAEVQRVLGRKPEGLADYEIVLNDLEAHDPPEEDGPAPPAGAPVQGNLVEPPPVEAEDR